MLKWGNTDLRMFLFALFLSKTVEEGCGSDLYLCRKNRWSKLSLFSLQPVISDNSPDDSQRAKPISRTMMSQCALGLGIGLVLYSYWLTYSFLVFWDQCFCRPKDSAPTVSATRSGSHQ